MCESLIRNNKVSMCIIASLLFLEIKNADNQHVFDFMHMINVTTYFNVFVHLSLLFQAHMDTHAKPSSRNGGKWNFTDYKIVKVIGATKERLLFQRKGKYLRGVSISKDAFLKMDDVSIVPGMQIELEPNVWLRNLGNQIHMVKYCITRDKKRCDGGFFVFSPKEWMHFWQKLKPSIHMYFEE